MRQRLIEILAGLHRRFPVKGFHRLLRLLHDPWNRETDRIETVLEVADGLRIQIDTSSLLEWHLFVYGDFEPGTRRLLEGLVPKGGVAIDVGANIGLHTLALGRAVGGDGRVIAVEPFPENAARLRRNISLNEQEHVELLICALADRDGLLPLYAYGGADAGLVASLTAENVAHPNDRIPGEKRVAVPVEVKVTTLDRIVGERHLDRLDLIKIDVEGHEIKVLRGARETLTAFSPLVLFEFNPRTWRNAGASLSDAREILGGLGYRLYNGESESPEPLGGETPEGTTNLLAAHERSHGEDDRPRLPARE